MGQPNYKRDAYNMSFILSGVNVKKNQLRTSVVLLLVALGKNTLNTVQPIVVFKLVVSQQIKKEINGKSNRNQHILNFRQRMHETTRLGRSALREKSSI